MKKISQLFTALSLFLLSVGPAAAQLIDSETAAGFASNVGREAGFAPNMSVGYVVSVMIRGFLGLMGIIFIILIVLAGSRWMNSGGNEETVKKAQETIKNSIIGLIIVLAAWAITYFIFRALPFGTTGGGGPQLGTGG